MRVSFSRARLLAAAAILLVVVALVLGLVLPPDSTSGSPNALSADSPQLVVSEYSDEESTLWLVDPADTTIRQPLFPIAHAPGWAIEGAVSPGGDRLALLVVPPDGHDPHRDTRLLISDGGPPRVLAEGLDLRGGVVWAADGSDVFARRVTDRETTAFALVAIDAADGAERTLLERGDGAAIYPVGRPLGGPVFAVSVGAGGSQLVQVAANVTHVQLSSVVTRDWTLSPDGDELAFTEQRGAALRVMAARLDAAPSLRVAQATRTDEMGGSAAPAWRPDGRLSVGRFEDTAAVRSAAAAVASDSAGFTLPLAWSADGAYLALRSFAGRGPGAPGRELAAVRGPSGEVQTITGDRVEILGWWHAPR